MVSSWLTRAASTVKVDSEWMEGRNFWSDHSL